MTDDTRPTMSSGVYYRDPLAALKWLEQAFGFETTMVVENADGSIGHCEMRFGEGLIFVGREWDERYRSPASMGGVNTQSLHFNLESGVDAHFERARAAGAVVLREPADQFYGDRSYMVMDPEGHMWSFSQTIEAMSYDDMAKRGGVKVRERL
ncbi:MAG: VOC family protein [Caulobacteraceae bacterium]